MPPFSSVELLKAFLRTTLLKKEEPGGRNHPAYYEKNITNCSALLNVIHPGEFFIPLFYGFSIE